MTHPFQPIIDILRQANADDLRAAYDRRISEELYECWNCGDWSRMKVSNVKRWRDQGEPCEEMICDRCVERGWRASKMP